MSAVTYQTIPGWRPLDRDVVVKFDLAEWEELSVDEIPDLREPIEIPAWVHETTWAEIDPEGWTIHPEPAERTVFYLTRAQLIDELREDWSDE